MNKLSPMTFERARRGEPQQTGPNIADLYRALAQAQGEFPDIPRRRIATVKLQSGGSYSYTYADLADVFSAVTPVLSHFGLSVMQWPDGDNLVTLLAHEGGATLTTRYPILQRQDQKMHPAQNYSAGLTFAKRYALTAMLGIATEESVEGDDSRRHDPDPPNGKKENPFSAGLKDAWSDAVKDSLPEGASPRQIAEAYASALETEFAKYKSPAGLNGAWNKRQRIIDKLAEKHDDLYQTVFDAFHSNMDALTEAGK